VRLRVQGVSLMNTPEIPASNVSSLTSLIFPAFNPGSLIDQSYATIRNFLIRSRENWEVVFVCDGCTDGTPERLQSLVLAGGIPMRVLSYAQNRGKGYAVRQGMLAARGRWRIFTDVDLAYDFSDVERVARALAPGAEVAIASRDHPQSELVLPPRLIGYLFRRHMQSYVFGAIARRLLRIDQHDTQAGLKGMSAAVVENIVPRLRCDGFGFDCELLAACARFTLGVEEVPVRVRYQDAASTTGWRTVRRMVSDLFRIRRDWRNSVPSPQASAEDVQELRTSRRAEGKIAA
jgi:dolichyl-phosphate beta-glucosyltransferase